MGRHSAVEVKCREMEDGMLITGGYLYIGGTTQTGTVEAYNPYISKICMLPNLPQGIWGRSGHTFCGGLICGGRRHHYNNERTCHKFGQNGQFVRANVSLQQPRKHHLCWNVPEGVLLLGGDRSPSTTELVLRDGSASVSKFDLTHPAM